MIYVIGGASRAGKTTLTRQMCREYGFSYFSLDLLTMGIVKGGMNQGFTGDSPDHEIAHILWPVIRGMLETMHEDGWKNYIIEGITILPEHISELHRKYPGACRACWVGYAEIDPQNKVYQLRQAGAGEGHDWLANASDKEVLETVVSGIENSHILKNQCEQEGFPYFDTSAEFQKTLDDAKKYLLSEKNETRMIAAT